MKFYHISIKIILLFSLFDSYYSFNTIHLNPGIPVNITNLKENDTYVFNFDAYYSQKIRIKIITNKSFRTIDNNFRSNYVVEIKEYFWYQDYFMDYSLYLFC